MAQLLVSFILLSSNYSLLYFTSAALILPLLFVLSKSLRGFKDVRYQKIPFKETVATVHHDKNVSLAFVVGFLLQFFFAWMVIYTPIYLHNHIGFSWPELGLMFGLVLIPFVITEEPLGQLADTHLGEKEIMTIGFLIAAIFTTLVSFTDSNNFWVWTGILFMTRIGASMVEIMCETYFFKKVSASKIHILSLFRTLRPIAYLISPLIATLLFTVMDIKYLFAVLGILMLYGVHFSMSLEDTR
jgi:MFS family permease